LKLAASVGRVRTVSDAARQAPVVTGSQILAAGFAAAAAAIVTSRFGVAGTLLGSALTAMIITGGSAILKAYLETVTGNVRKVPRRLRARREQRKAGSHTEPETLPERPDLRDNFAGRIRAALGWFSHLPPLTRRSILVKGLIAAAVAFVIGMGTVFALEQGIGNSLSCGIWAKCPEGASPGIHLGENRNTGARPTLSLGRAKPEAAPGYERQNPAYQQNGVQQNRSYQQQQAPDNRQPAPSDNQPGREDPAPQQPVEEPQVPEQPKPPSSASPAPDEGASPPPDEASPPAQKNSPSRAAPAPSQ
jgi:hypothetical protein